MSATAIIRPAPPSHGNNFMCILFTPMLCFITIGNESA